MARPPLLAIRIKDGIFVGNRTASEDEDFLIQNKVTHIVNCAGAEIPNLHHDAGIVYMTFGWRDLPTQRLFDERQFAPRLTDFVDSALARGECCLIHGQQGVNRSCAAAAAYLMSKYGWQAANAVNFMQLAHPDMDLRDSFRRQLKALGELQAVVPDIFHSDLDSSSFCFDNEQWALRNTYLNALPFDHQRNAKLRSELESVPTPLPAKIKRGKRITWNSLPYPGDGHDPGEPMPLGCPVIRWRESVASIVVSRKLPIEHQLEHPDGITCFRGPWNLHSNARITHPSHPPHQSHADPHAPPATRQTSTGGLAASAFGTVGSVGAPASPRPTAPQSAVDRLRHGDASAASSPSMPPRRGQDDRGPAAQVRQRGAFASINARRGSPMRRGVTQPSSGSGNVVPAIARIQALHGVNPPGQRTYTSSPRVNSGTHTPPGVSPRALPPKLRQPASGRNSPAPQPRRGSLGGRDSPTRDYVTRSQVPADTVSLRRAAAAGNSRQSGYSTSTDSPRGNISGQFRRPGSPCPRPASGLPQRPLAGTSILNSARRSGESPLPDDRTGSAPLSSAVRRVAAANAYRDSPGRRTNSPSERLLKQTQSSANRRRPSFKT
eukprot:Hpha_TRINITY_DN14860_c2_g8::TRINITY_DN14860_c2_g8_i1::g.169450::m.169450